MKDCFPDSFLNRMRWFAFVPTFSFYVEEARLKPKPQADKLMSAAAAVSVIVMIVTLVLDQISAPFPIMVAWIAYMLFAFSNAFFVLLAVFLPSK